MTRIPSNAKRGPLPRPQEWMRRDDWDEPRPLSRDDLGTLLSLVPAAVVIVAAFLAGAGFAIVVLR